MKKLATPVDKKSEIDASLASNSSSIQSRKRKSATNAVKSSPKMKTTSSNNETGSSDTVVQAVSVRSTSATIASKNLIPATMSPLKAKKRMNQGKSESASAKGPMKMTTTPRKTTIPQQAPIIANDDLLITIQIPKNLIKMMPTLASSDIPKKRIGNPKNAFNENMARRSRRRRRKLL